MPVYVDDARHPYGNMLMCHMIADTRAELLAIATQIGVAHRWIQFPHTAKEHFDICVTKRAAALRAGAIPVSSREIVRRIRLRTQNAKQRRAPR